MLHEHKNTLSNSVHKKVNLQDYIYISEQVHEHLHEQSQFLYKQILQVLQREQF